MFKIIPTATAKAQLAQLKQAAETARKNREENNKKSKKKSKSSKQEGLYKQVCKAINLLSNNPKHPSLQTHEYDAIPNPYNKKEKVWEAYVQNHASAAWRLFWCYGPGKNEITIIAVTPHP
ncbi:MAG: hypothetical protein GC159_02070 [Phycisphaera sp.]|nr:hypothetical protein [Phycisphaera sp.]